MATFAELVYIAPYLDFRTVVVQLILRKLTFFPGHACALSFYLSVGKSIKHSRLWKRQILDRLDVNIKHYMSLHTK